jgi:hypothetical protein
MSAKSQRLKRRVQILERQLLVLNDKITKAENFVKNAEQKLKRAACIIDFAPWYPDGCGVYGLSIKIDIRNIARYSRMQPGAYELGAVARDCAMQLEHQVEKLLVEELGKLWS